MNDRWYGRLFADARKKRLITGEITPAYGLLSETTIKRIQTINPAVKVLFFMRDPVERCWSQAVKGLARGRRRAATEISDSEYIKFLDSKGCRARSAYGAIIEKWSKYIPASQIFIGFYDQLRDNPEYLLKSVFTFLSIDPGAYPDYSIKTRQRVNVASYGHEMPGSIRKYLIQRYRDEVRALEKYGQYPYNWLKEYERV